jgi:4-hydroxy-tetrahydrodipicolinate synthase
MAFVETNPGPVKWAMERLGILSCGDVRPPLASPTPASQERIVRILTDVGHLDPAAAR